MAREYDDEIDFEDDVEEDEEIVREDVEILDVWWAEDIRKIENSDIQRKEIEAAERLLNEKKEREDRYIEEKKDFRGFWAENPDLHMKETRTATRCAIESDGLTWDHLIDLSDDTGHLTDIEYLEQKDRDKNLLKEVDPEVGKEFVENVIEEEEELSEEGAESLRRLVRLRELESK